MGNNIFMTDRLPIRFEEYLQYDENSRENLGQELPVLVYRMLEYSLKEELCRRFGKETQMEVFRSAGRMAGEYFAKHMLNLAQPLNQFVGELQTRLQELKIGVLRIEEADEMRIDTKPDHFHRFRRRRLLRSSGSRRNGMQLR